MITTKKWRRFIGLLLCFSLLTGLLPTRVFADGTSNEIQSVYLNMKMPQAGKCAEFSAAPNSSEYAVRNNYTNTSEGFKNGVSWYDVSAKKYMTANDVFEVGKTYNYKVQIYSVSPYDFVYERWQSSTTAYWGTAAYVNGIRCEMAFAYEKQNYVNVSGSYTVPQYITEAVVYTNLPVGSGYVAKPGITGNDKFSLYNMYWRNIEGDPVTFLSGGTYYELVMTLKANDGYVFNINDRIWKGAKINGYTPNTSMPNDADGDNIDRYIVLTLGYTMPKGIGDIFITINEPAIGNMPARYPYDVQTTYGHNYDQYCCDVEALWYEDGKMMDGYTPFTAGHSYSAEFLITAADGYSLLTNREDVSQILFKVNGKAVDVYEAYDMPVYKGMEAAYDFGVLDDPNITRVDIKGVTAPQVGKYISYNPVSCGSTYRVNKNYNAGYNTNGLVWYEDGVPLPYGETFKSGKTYTVEIALLPNDGYQFASPVATINGCEADASWLGKNGGYITYSFNTPISTLPLTVAAPEAGDTPGRVTDNGGTPCSVDAGSIKWTDVTAGRVIDLNTVFIAGHKYKISLTLTADGEYLFADTLKATVNGSDAFAETVNGAKAANIEYTFSPCTVGGLEITGLAVPKEGDTPAYDAQISTDGISLDTAADGEYCKNGVSWYDRTDNAYLLPTDTFKATHSYYAYVNVKADGTVLGNDIDMVLKTADGQIKSGVTDIKNNKAAARFDFSNVPISVVNIAADEPLWLGTPASTEINTDSTLYHITDVEWYYGRIPLADGYKFEKNNEYRADIYIEFSADQNLVSDDLSVYANGVNVPFVKNGENGIIVTLYFHIGGDARLGDVNADGAVDEKDAELVIRYVSQLDILTYEQLCAADCDYSKTVNLVDAILIMKNW